MASRSGAGLQEQQIEEIVDFGDLRVFESATTYPCILRIRKGTQAKSFRVTQVKTLDFESLSEYVTDHSYPVDKSFLGDKAWSLSDEQIPGDPEQSDESRGPTR